MGRRKDSPASYRKHWCCTSCGKKLPESKKGWGLIWDTSECGMCQKCLYTIRKAIGYYDKPKELRSYAPKTRKKKKESFFVKEHFEEMYAIAKTLFPTPKGKPFSAFGVSLRRMPRRFSLVGEQSNIKTSLQLRNDDFGYLVEIEVGGDVSKKAFESNQKEDALMELLNPHLRWEIEQKCKKAVNSDM